MTLLVVLLRPPAPGALRGLTWLLAGAALITPLERSPAWWGLLTTIVAARLVSDWPFADNHIYLLAYWCLGVALCLRVPGPFAAIARMSRWLIGAAFLCAIIWKGLLAPDFLDARFFRVTLITDERFADLARAIGGLTDQQLLQNRDALAALPAGAEVIDGPVLVEPPALRRLGMGLTWGGFALELLLAVAFLIPRRWALHSARHVLLLTFCVVTYAVAPVAGFGWLLIAMGLAQCDETQQRMRAAYLCAFVLVLLYAETPIISALLTAAR